MAAVECLTALVGPNLPSLFEPSAVEVQREIGRFAGGDRFSALAREFFARLTWRSLNYYLSRELSNHIGAAERFPHDWARSQFNDALVLQPDFCGSSSFPMAFAGSLLVPAAPV